MIDLLLVLGILWYAIQCVGRHDRHKNESGVDPKNTVRISSGWGGERTRIRHIWLELFVKDHPRTRLLALLSL